MVFIIIRYRNSKIWSGKWAPGKSTSSGKGNKGSSRTANEEGKAIYFKLANILAPHVTQEAESIDTQALCVSIFYRMAYKRAA